MIFGLGVTGLMIECILAAVDLAWFWRLVLHALYVWQISKKKKKRHQKEKKNTISRSVPAEK